MNVPNLNLQSYDEQKTPSNSDSDEDNKYGHHSDRASRIQNRNNDMTYPGKLDLKGNSLDSHSAFGELDNVGNRKILYRVSKKIYTPNEIELVRDLVVKNRKGKLKKYIHYGSSIVMITLIAVMCILILVQIGRQWVGKWETNMATVSIQDPSIQNYVSYVSVIRYFLYNNSSGSKVYINGNLATRGVTAYTDVTYICGNTKAYIGTQTDISYIEGSITSPFVLTFELVFIILMLLWMGYIIYRTWRKLKIYRIPLFLRSNNVSPWSYKQRFKLSVFWLYIIISSIFTRYNMLDLDQKWIYCFNGYDWYSVDFLNHATITLALCILLPFIIVILLQQFSEKLRYVIIPFILVNSLFMFVMIMIAAYSIGMFLIKTTWTPMRVIHGLDILTAVISFILILISDRYWSSEFDYYEES